MSSPDFEVRENLQSIADQIKPQIPPGWGFALFVFPVEGREGNLNYISTAKRDDMIMVLIKWLQHQLENPDKFGKHAEEI